jgi:phage terminase large subunit GpA-like protein
VTYAKLDDVIANAMKAWKPPQRRSLSEWADEFFVLSPESAAEPGRWRTLPYQRGLMDAITDPAVTQVSIMKSARIGYTLCVTATIGYHIHQDPASILVVQPTVEDAKNFSKESIAPMIRDVPVLADIHFRELGEKGPKDSSNTLRHKAFPGGVLSLIGANSGSGFRRISRRVILLDEVDAYPPSAGSEGDPVKLATMRSQAFWNRKIISGSTPLIAGHSRIEELFLAGDQRRYHVPCPHCGHVDILVFREGPRGHWMAWPEGKPSKAHFVCSKNGCVIEHKSKRWMIERGGWRGDAPFKGHASFHIWAAYSHAPNATWGQIATEFVEAKSDPEKLKTFITTILGETWVERGEAPPWENLYRRREQYQAGTVPDGTVLLTAGVDVQKDRLVFEVVAWCNDKSSYSIDQGCIPGEPSTAIPWLALDEMLNGSWPDSHGVEHSIRMMAVDAGNWAQAVYNWCRTKPLSRVIAVRGYSAASTLIGRPTKVDVTVSGRTLSRGYRVWMVGVSIAKTELYGWLCLEPPLDSSAPFPPGYCHFPDSYGEEFFKELTAEQLVAVKKRGGYTVLEWSLIPNRQNHALDARIYARCAAALCGLDRYAAKHAGTRASPAPDVPVAPATQPEMQPTPAPTPAPRQKPPPRGWLYGRGRGSTGDRGSGGWLGRRR